jgi:CheY-specific phosphatase CheX
MLDYLLKISTLVYTMEVEFINPFIIGAIEIFEKVAKIELKKSEVKMLKSTHPSNEICIAFGVFGYLTGQAVYSFKPHTAERVVSCMMPNSSIEKQKEYFDSALGALANMITGRATILLAGKEQIIRITPPIININNKSDSFQYVGLPTISVTFTSRFGSLEINIALRKSA